MPTIDEFRAELAAQIERAIKQGRPHVEINAGELHRVVGGYPPKSGENHNMPQCCDAMAEEFPHGYSETIYAPPVGKGASLTIRYYLRRGSSA